jgi:hypothetical protein
MIEFTPRSDFTGSNITETNYTDTHKEVNPGIIGVIPESTEPQRRSFRQSYKPLLAARRRVKSLPLPDEESAESFYTRALNNDNHIDAVRLVKLFERHYGREHPYQKVYETDFWSTSMQTRLDNKGMVSIVAVRDDEFIGHLAFDHNPETGAAQLLLPAIDPEHRNKLFPMIRAFWRHIEQTAQRQQWKLITTFNLTSQPLLQLLAAKCFHCETTALLPSTGCIEQSDGIPNAETLQCSSVVVMFHIIQHHSLDSHILYPPLHHAEKVKEIMDGFNLPRVYALDYNGAEDAESGSDLSSAAACSIGDAKGFSLQSLKRLGIHVLQINPAALCNLPAAASLIERLENAPKIRRNTLIVQVAMDSPKCPALCEQLEERGYRFCGVSPLTGGHDFVAYARFEDAVIKRPTLYTERSKSLREYMLQQNGPVRLCDQITNQTADSVTDYFGPVDSRPPAWTHI